jgi:translation initiation factor 2 beta subunit (eIF-2beta)/eIF-5
MFRRVRRYTMCKMCGSDDVVVNGEDIALVCEKCKEAAWVVADSVQADSWRVGIDDYGVEEIEEVVYE